MVKAVWAEFQGRPHPLRGLQTLLIGLIHQWSLNYLALAGSLLLPLVLPRLTRTIVEPICSLLSWRP